MLEHPLTALIESVNTTHPGLGNLAAISVVAAKARQCLITVAAPGTGKSTITNWLQAKHPNAFVEDSYTRSSLKALEEQFNGFDGLLLIDDIGKIDSDWSRVQTLVTLAELVYGHFIGKHTKDIHINIDDFHGAAVMNIQPNVLKEVIEHPTWQSNLADKSLRYYHLYRAIDPALTELDVEIDWGLNFPDVLKYEGDPVWFDAILDIGLQQWTRARAMEHCHALIRAVAALGNHYAPDQVDCQVLLELMLPMTVEMEVSEQSGFGGKVTLNVGLLYLLSEFASYQNVTYEIIAQDMKIKIRRVAMILESMSEWFEKVGINPVILQPTKELTQLLKRAGLR